MTQKTELAILRALLVLSICINIGYYTWYVRISRNTTELQITQSSLEELKLNNNLLLKELEQNKSFVLVNKSVLLEDLRVNFPNISNTTRTKIVQTIVEEAQRYGVNPMILYSICYVESSFRFWLEHDDVKIPVKGKEVKTKAVGLTGVIWEYWEEPLKIAGIAETKGDLFDPLINIKASAFIYNENFNKELLKGAKTRDESALLRYFGGNFPSYVQKIDAKMASLVRPTLFRKD